MNLQKLFIIGWALTLLSCAAVPKRVETQRRWTDSGICTLGREAAPCLRVVDGPAVVERLEVARSCPDRLVAAIKDTWGAEEGLTYWWVQAPSQTQLILQDIHLDVGKSLFIGTNESYEKVDKNCSLEMRIR